MDRRLSLDGCPSDWHFWVFFAVLVALYFAFNRWRTSTRRRALAQVAPSIGFRLSDTVPEIPRDIAFLRTGFGGECTNAMIGSSAGCEATLFDFEYQTGITIKTVRTHAQTIAAFRSARPLLPAFQFGPETVLRKDADGRIGEAVLVRKPAAERASCDRSLSLAKYGSGCGERAVRLGHAEILQRRAIATAALGA